MPRTLNDEICKMRFHDKISGDDIAIHYRLPSSDERIAYANAMVTRKGNKIINTAGAARRKYGLAILEGFADGSFDKGKGQPLSSDPASPHYDPAWKAIIAKYASDVVEMLAIMVFEASLATVETEGADADAEESDDDPS